jgi:hypothetical protein
VASLTPTSPIPDSLTGAIVSPVIVEPSDLSIAGLLPDGVPLDIIGSTDVERHGTRQQTTWKPQTTHFRHADLAWSPVQSSSANGWRDGARSGHGSDSGGLR